MPTFSQASLDKLFMCHRDLVDICSEAIKIMDFTIIYGHRDKEGQDKAFAEGNSKLKWPNSLHNKSPSVAVDLAPYPIDWNDVDRFILLAGIMKAVAHMKGIKLTWGGDWDSDCNLREERFRDMGHFELGK